MKGSLGLEERTDCGKITSSDQKCGLRFLTATALVKILEPAGSFMAWIRPDAVSLPSGCLPAAVL